MKTITQWQIDGHFLTIHGRPYQDTYGNLRYNYKWMLDQEEISEYLFKLLLNATAKLVRHRSQPVE